MCGIIGLLYAETETHCAQGLVDALTMLQHRGQDAAGIVTSFNNRLNMRKDNGTVADVFTQKNIVALKGNIGIGHVRYPTAGGSNSAEAQPLYTNAPFGIALAHNGNLTNTESLQRMMEKEHRHINTDSDSELLLNLFADEVQRRNITSFDAEDLFDATKMVMRKVQGAYGVIILINRIGLIAFRDPNGIRPLCFGKKPRPDLGDDIFDYAIASESVAIENLDYNPSFRLERDVQPGEAVFIDVHGRFYSKSLLPSANFTPCLFEYVYFARPDSVSHNCCFL
jgi:amidophosphoribosyltransferase